MRICDVCVVNYKCTGEGKYQVWNLKLVSEERQDLLGLNCIKGASGKVIVDDKGIRDSWKEYVEKTDE